MNDCKSVPVRELTRISLLFSAVCRQGRLLAAKRLRSRRPTILDPLSHFPQAVIADPFRVALVSSPGVTLATKVGERNVASAPRREVMNIVAKARWGEEVTELPE